MFCKNCLNLNKLATKRKCLRCKSEIVNNLSVLCTSCSDSSKECEICLKKIQNSSVLKYNFGGCGSCGR